MNKTGSMIFCAVFFVLILAPLVLMPWSQNSLAENRLPAPPPELIKDGTLNLSLPGDTEEFFKDRFAGRTQMIDAYSHVVGGIFGISANDKVIMGRDGWLFFQETVGDYDGSAALSDAEMDLFIKDLLVIKSKAEARGQTFLIAVAPNKNSIYGEFMPSGYRRTEAPTNLERLLAAEGLDCIDLMTVLKFPEETIYYRTDTHWNALGARIAAREIMLTVEEKTGIRVEYDWEGALSEAALKTGDLGQMLYPADPPEESDCIYADTKQNYSAIGRYRSPDDLNITTESEGAALRVAMFRDSFANALIPYFSNAYSNVHYTRQTPPPMDSDVFLEADVIIFVIAERRLNELADALHQND